MTQKTSFFSVLNEIPLQAQKNFVNFDYLMGLMEGHYNLPWRKYHNLSHLVEIFDNWNRVPIILADSIVQSMTIAILFHDVIYDVHAKPGENELDSYEFLKEHHGDCFRYCDLDMVYNLIMATTHDKNYSPYNSDAVKLMADLDLGSFAAAYPRFRAVNDEVIAEYSHWYPRYNVLAGRIAFLQSFKNKNPFFHIAFNSDMAVGNIEKEIRYLENLIKTEPIILPTESGAHV